LEHKKFPPKNAAGAVNNKKYGKTSFTSILSTICLETVYALFVQLALGYGQKKPPRGVLGGLCGRPVPCAYAALRNCVCFCWPPAAGGLFGWVSCWLWSLLPFLS